MKIVLLTLTVLTLAGTTATYKVAQAASRMATTPAPVSTHAYCHDEWYCGVNGCRIITVCN